MQMQLLNMSLDELVGKHPGLKSFMTDMGLDVDYLGITLREYIQSLDDLTLEDVGLGRRELSELISAYLQHLQDVRSHETKIGSLIILGGRDKEGQPEDCNLEIKSGEIVCVVGPTGSGKSRLLEDIEWLAQGDTPTGRRILIDGDVPEADSQFSCSRKLVAQLTQHMNFVMDITVRDFIMMHAESRMIGHPGETVERVLEQANLLSGEAITGEMFVTYLSGGQSRALMIADIACLSQSPVVLIDEIENAGINRNTALDILVKSEKIILIVTHDPILALLGNRRLVMKNGRISKVIERSRDEIKLLAELQRLEDYMNRLRHNLREGVQLPEKQRCPRIP